jgi:hypothetical protein
MVLGNEQGMRAVRFDGTADGLTAMPMGRSRFAACQSTAMEEPSALRFGSVTARTRSRVDREIRGMGTRATWRGSGSVRFLSANQPTGVAGPKPPWPRDCD